MQFLFSSGVGTCVDVPEAKYNKCNLGPKRRVTDSDYWLGCYRYENQRYARQVPPKKSGYFILVLKARTNHLKRLSPLST